MYQPQSSWVNNIFHFLISLLIYMCMIIILYNLIIIQNENINNIIINILLILAAWAKAQTHWWVRNPVKMSDPKNT